MVLSYLVGTLQAALQVHDKGVHGLQKIQMGWVGSEPIKMRLGLTQPVGHILWVTYFDPMWVTGLNRSNCTLNMAFQQGKIYHDPSYRAALKNSS